MNSRDEFIQFIVEAVEELEDINSTERLKLLDKLNLMSYEELETEADFYEELLMK